MVFRTFFTRIVRFSRTRVESVEPVDEVVVTRLWGSVSFGSAAPGPETHRTAPARTSSPYKRKWISQARDECGGIDTPLISGYTHATYPRRLPAAG